jgi:hypothetical protein
MTTQQAIALLEHKIARRQQMNEPGVMALRANKAPILAISLTLRAAEELLALLRALEAV